MVSPLFSSKGQTSTWFSNQSGAPEVWGQHIFPQNVCLCAGGNATMRPFWEANCFKFLGPLQKQLAFALFPNTLWTEQQPGTHRPLALPAMRVPLGGHLEPHCPSSLAAGPGPGHTRASIQARMCLAFGKAMLLSATQPGIGKRRLLALHQHVAVTERPPS